MCWLISDDLITCEIGAEPWQVARANAAKWCRCEKLIPKKGIIYKKCMEKRIVPKVAMRRKQHIKVCKELDNQQLKWPAKSTKSEKAQCCSNRKPDYNMKLLYFSHWYNEEKSSILIYKMLSRQNGLLSLVCGWY